MTMFAWTGPEVVRNTSIARLCQSILSFMIYATYIKYNLGRKLNSRKMTMTALGGLILFHLLSYSWPFLPGHVKTFNNEGVYHVSPSFEMYYNP